MDTTLIGVAILATFCLVLTLLLAREYWKIEKGLDELESRLNELDSRSKALRSEEKKK